ncbi:hypothetical protein [Nonomuraea sp. NPDC002799]
MTKRDRIRKTRGAPRRLTLSVPQIAGSALAAITAAVAASYLGVAGTVIGAAVMSFATTVATDIYTHYLRRTSAKVKQHTTIARRGRPGAADAGPRMPAGAPARPFRRGLPWAKLSVAAALAFTVSMSGILTYQVIVDQTVADQVTGRSLKRAAPEKTRARKDRHVEPAAAQAPFRRPAVGTAPSGQAASPTPAGSPAARTTPPPTPTPTPTSAETGAPESSATPSPKATPEETGVSPSSHGAQPAVSPAARDPQAGQSGLCAAGPSWPRHPAGLLCALERRMSGATPRPPTS